MFCLILCLCTALSFPSLFLCFKLWQKDYLGTLFNMNTAMVLLMNGKIKLVMRFQFFLLPCLSVFSIFFTNNNFPAILMLMLYFSGVSTPITSSLFLYLLLIDPDDSSFPCGVLISLRIVYAYVLIYALAASFINR